MKKIIFSLCVILTFILLTHQKQPLKFTHIMKKDITIRPQQARTPEREPANKENSMEKIKIHYQKIPGKEYLEILPQLTASMKEINGAELIFEADGLFFYDQSLYPGKPAIYNALEKRYGIFSGEITLSGDLRLSENLALESGWEILLIRERNQKMIVEVREQSLLQVIEELRQTNLAWELDVRYSKFIR
jgi:hypothetical protein